MRDTSTKFGEFLNTQKDIINNNTVLLRLKSQISQNARKTTIYIKRYGGRVIIVFMIIIVFIIYFLVFFKRVPKFLDRMDYYYKNLSKVTSIRNNKTIMNGAYKLCDFYVASSYKSYLPCTNYIDYASIDAIKKTLSYGARYIDLDVMNKSFSSCPKLVICNGVEVGNWHLTTSIDFEETIKVISEYAFSNVINNNSDPLFININLKTWYNKDSYEVCAEILNKYFKHKYLPLEYGFKGRHSGVDISQTNIKNLLNKVIIVCNNDVTDTTMDEIVNMGSGVNGNIREVTNSDIEECLDIYEYRDFNKNYLSLVKPDFKGKYKQNFNYLSPYYLGCQFICMNYTEPDKWMKSYINTFGSYSFVLKPYKLREKYNEIKTPLKK